MFTKTTLMVVALMAVLAIATASTIAAPALAVPTGKGNPPATACGGAAAPFAGAARECGQGHAAVTPGPPP